MAIKQISEIFFVDARDDESFSKLFINYYLFPINNNG